MHARVRAYTWMSRRTSRLDLRTHSRAVACKQLLAISGTTGAIVGKFSRFVALSESKTAGAMRSTRVGALLMRPSAQPQCTIVAAAVAQHAIGAAGRRGAL